MMRILLVDQSEAIRAIEKTVLTALGEVTFTESGDGAEAMHLFDLAVHSDAPFDLVVLEATIPTVDGMALVSRIRALDKSVSIAMATGEVEKTKVLEAIKAGVNAYIVKPFTPETLLGKIQAVLDRKKVTA